jgi:DNA-binding transcriptional MocR family regulator
MVFFTMQIWIPDLSAATGPKYRAVAAALIHDIETGRLKPGDRLPPQRQLAAQLAIDLTTVTKAYNEVSKLGLIEAGGRRGSFVRERPKMLALSSTDTQSPDWPTSDNGMIAPPEPQAGSFAERYRLGMSALLSGPGAIARFGYQPMGGAPSDRAAGTSCLSLLGLDTQPDQLVLASGGQNALQSIIQTALKPGDAICVAAFAYTGFLAVARKFGLRLIPVESDTYGLIPQAIDAACRAQTIRALYVVPTNDNPTTRTMDLSRRRAVANVVERHGLALIEDDAYGLQPVQPLSPITSFVPDKGWYIASLSKIVSPALRVAYVRAPTVKGAWRLAAEIHASAIMPPPINTALVSHWINNGDLPALIAETRAECMARQRIAAQALSSVDYATHPQGFHLWLPLPDGLARSSLQGGARSIGLSVVPSDAFATTQTEGDPALRLSIGGALSHAQLARALSQFEALLESGLSLV